MTEEHLSDIIRRAQTRDAEAFDEIIDHFGPRLFGFFCRLCGSRSDAEDLLQELFLRVVGRIERYRHDGQFEAWLFRIATNLVRDRLRRIKRRPLYVSIDRTQQHEEEDGSSWTPPDDSASSPSKVAQQREEVDRLQRALEELPQAEREVVMLRHFSQLSFAEIARTMETPLGTALARAYRGLVKLRTVLEATE